MLNCEINNFIGVFHGVLSKEFCNQTIANFQRMEELNRTYKRNYLSVEMNNKIFFTNDNHVDENLFYQNSRKTEEFCKVSWECYKIYQQKYGILEILGKHGFYDDIKVQKTLPTEGYHIWHCEHGQRDLSPRLLLVLAYLNTVEEGGETEFLYQSLRIKPTMGTIIICPAGFTHTHRGNPPLSGVKYVMNGWIEFME